MTYTIDFERKADEMDEPFVPTADDYEGDPDHIDAMAAWRDDYCPVCGDPIDYCLGGHATDTCAECEGPKESILGPYCNECQAQFDRDFDYGFNVLYYES